MSTIIYDADFYARQIQGSVSSASVIARIVFSLVNPKSVLDVGCGLGGWLAAFSDAGVQRVLGIDGHCVGEHELRISPTAFRRTDLTHSFSLGERFDLTISMEVAEHLPRDRAESFVADLVKTSEIVLFSAAIPHQGGIAHINEQWQSYWAALFAQQGYVAIDAVRGQVWKNPDVSWWYAQNAILYASTTACRSMPALAEMYARTQDQPLDLVHPRAYLAAANIKQMSFRRAVQGARFAVLRKFVRQERNHRDRE